MMAKKDPDWDVTRGEEKVVAELWSDYLNTKFKDVPDENAKLLLAIGSTLTTYAPRAIGYATKIKAQRKPKKKEENEQTEPVQETETIKYEVNNNVFDQEAKKFEQDFSNRRPIQG
jgi:CRISPR/Cas system-associated protein Csx1